MVVLFLSNCDKTDRCEEILTDLEEIDEQLENIGILFVYTDDETYAAKLKVTTFPTIAYFRLVPMVPRTGNSVGRATT